MYNYIGTHLLGKEVLANQLLNNYLLRTSFSRSVMSDSLQPHRLWLTRLLCLWISQAGILEWVAIPFCRGSSQPRD